MAQAHYEQEAPVIAQGSEFRFVPAQQQEERSPRKHKHWSHRHRDTQDLSQSLQYDSSPRGSDIIIRSSQESFQGNGALKGSSLRSSLETSPQEKGAMIVREMHQELARPLNSEELALREEKLRERERHFAMRAEAYIEKELAKAEAKLERDLARAETRERADRADAAYHEAMVQKKAEKKLAELQAKMAAKIAEAKDEHVNAEIRATQKAKRRTIEAEENYRWAVVNAKETAELIRRGEYTPPKASALSKLTSKLHL